MAAAAKRKENERQNIESTTVAAAPNDATNSVDYEDFFVDTEAKEEEDGEDDGLPKFENFPKKKRGRGDANSFSGFREGF